MKKAKPSKVKAKVKAPAKRTVAKKWDLRLYVAGQTPRSLQALSNLKRICEDHLAGDYRVEIIDLLKKPQLAAGDPGGGAGADPLGTFWGGWGVEWLDVRSAPPQNSWPGFDP